MVRAILNAACRAPTSSNLQAYSLIVVRNSDVRKQLSMLTGNQQHVAEARGKANNTRWPIMRKSGPILSFSGGG